MRVLVIGQRQHGPVVARSVTPAEFFGSFGPYAQYLWENARGRTVVIEGHTIRLELVA